jgi:two-component system chemotaxis response regulator CheY
MKALILEDEPLSQSVMTKLLAPAFDNCYPTANGREALEAFENALDSGHPYNLVCLDIMVPELDGISVLKSIRNAERQRKISGARAAKVVMTTCLSDEQTMKDAYSALCDAYLVKPINRQKMTGVLQELKLAKLG